MSEDLDIATPQTALIQQAQAKLKNAIMIGDKEAIETYTPALCQLLQGWSYIALGCAALGDKKK